MVAVVKISSHIDFTLTRESGNHMYKIIRGFLDNNPQFKKLIIDFENVRDVSVSFIQSTVVKLVNEQIDVELINYNPSIRFKIATLVKITDVDPKIFKKADQYPPAPYFV